MMKKQFFANTVAGLSAACVMNLSLAQTPAPAAAPAATPAAAAPAPHPNLARNLAAQCANCHGTDGKGQEAIPALAGRPAAYNIAQMKAFKEGTRTGPAATIMHQIAKGYSDAQIELMAKWFEAQK